MKYSSKNILYVRKYGHYSHPNIQELEDKEIFVFGSNESGFHGAGAAKLAADKFGAWQHVGNGLKGSSYAIPTKSIVSRSLTLPEIECYVALFFIRARMKNDHIFLLTEIGCGLEGFKPEQIAPMFPIPNGRSPTPPNVILPLSFKKYHLDRGATIRQSGRIVG